METKKFCLTEKQMPTQWYNIVADMPNKPLPPLHPGTKKPVTKEQMSAIFAEELIDQEMSTERYIDIPEEVQEIYRKRPSERPRRSFSRTKACRPRVRTNPTPPCRRPTTTTNRASST